MKLHLYATELHLLRRYREYSIALQQCITPWLMHTRESIWQLWLRQNDDFGNSLPLPAAQYDAQNAESHDVDLWRSHPDRVPMTDENSIEHLTPKQIEGNLLAMDICGRFAGDVEFLRLARKADKTSEDQKRMLELLRGSGVPIGFELRDPEAQR